MLQDIVVGRTWAIRFAAGQSLEGFTLGGVIAHDRAGAPVDLGGTLEMDAEGGFIIYWPVPGDLDAGRSPYAVRYRLADSEGRVFHLPHGPPALWRIWFP